MTTEDNNSCTNVGFTDCVTAFSLEEATHRQRFLA